MSGSANVFNLDIIRETIKAFNSIERDTDDQCQEALNKVERVLQQTSEELNRSNRMLEVARGIEDEKLAKKLSAEAKLAEAAAKLSAAAASADPISSAIAAAKVPLAADKVAKATEEYNEAKNHRERLERRVELAQQCVGIAEEINDRLPRCFGAYKEVISNDIFRGNNRLQNAYDDLHKYLSRRSRAELERLSDYYNKKVEKNKPIRPDDIFNRLNADSTVYNAILQRLYTTDLNFRSSVDRLCSQLSIPGNESSVELKIKKNIVGRFCEELVIQAFSPYGEKVETQGVFYFMDGTYTKIDMVLYGLKEPMILGRGEGRSAPKGGNLGIEVKSGKKEYILEQLQHMEKQAKGHSQCDLSCVICSRDIEDLPPETEQKIRSRLKEAGSPILKMLPRKAELDKECIDFVKAKAKEGSLQKKGNKNA